MNRRFSLQALFLVLAFVAAGNASGSSNILVHVTFVGLYGDGELFIRTSDTIDEPGCERPRIAIAPNHPTKEAWMSIAMMALATGKPIRVKTNSCWSGRPSIDESRSGWLYIEN